MDALRASAPRAPNFLCSLHAKWDAAYRSFSDPPLVAHTKNKNVTPPAEIKPRALNKNIVDKRILYQKASKTVKAMSIWNLDMAGKSQFWRKSANQ